MYHGSPAERKEIRDTRLNKKGPGFPVVCTSYDISMRDRKYLQKFKWRYIIIDEGHRIKNVNCKLIQELKEYTSANRLLLTGTPLQNNLSELWSLLNFLIPDVFNDLSFFEEYFSFTTVTSPDSSSDVEKAREQRLVHSLHALLKPFLLRRVKVDVMTALPPKREYILYAPLSQTQKDLYQALLHHEARDFLVNYILSYTSPSTPGGLKRKFFNMQLEDTPAGTLDAPRKSRKLGNVSYKEQTDAEYFRALREDAPPTPEETEEEEPDLDPYEKSVLDALKQVKNRKLSNLLMQLRSTCNSPHIFHNPWSDGSTPDNRLITESGKMMLLERLVPALMKRGHKVLIFSQFTEMLDLIELWATQLHDWNTCRIDGKVAQDERRAQMKLFNTSSDHNLFLLSTRAGGLGINLTSSDTVILFDSDWNPQNDLQAQDRAHRIGQTKPVLVYRLATKGTVEEMLLERADGKRRLEKLIIRKGDFKSLVKGGKEEEEVGLSENLLKEDFERVNVVQEGGAVLTDEELEQLLDRSEEAFAKKEVVGERSGGAAVKAV